MDNKAKPDKFEKSLFSVINFAFFSGLERFKPFLKGAKFMFFL